jgi:aryl-alcohol dehydrogenase-like predicted oxidoreductase
LELIMTGEQMRTRTIGSLEVSVVGLGCNNFAKKLNQDDSRRVVHAALDGGITLFDTSDRYGDGEHPYSGRGRSEEFLGEALRAHRDEVSIATKFGNFIGPDPRDGGGNRRWVNLACEASLKRLGTDYIDLYQIHRPDLDTPIAETLDALNGLVAAGKVREIGCSNFTEAQLTEALAVSAESGSPRFESLQNEYSLLRRELEDEVLPLCTKEGVRVLPYFPLACGLLTGKYSGGAIPEGSRLEFWAPRAHFNVNDDTLDFVDKLQTFAELRGHTLLELAMSWLASHEEVASVIAGATSPEQVASNVTAASWELSADDLAALDQLTIAG